MSQASSIVQPVRFERQDSGVITLFGEVNHHNAQQVLAQAESCMSQAVAHFAEHTDSFPQYFVLDLSKLTHMGSVLISVLLSMLRYQQQVYPKRQLVFVRCSNKMMDMVRVCGLDMVLPIKSDETHLK